MGGGPDRISITAAPVRERVLLTPPSPLPPTIPILQTVARRKCENVRVRVCAHACACVRVLLCMSELPSTPTCMLCTSSPLHPMHMTALVLSHAHAHTHTLSLSHTQTRTHAHAHALAQTHTCTHTHTHAHAHTHACTHTHTCCPPCAGSCWSSAGWCLSGCVWQGEGARSGDRGRQACGQCMRQRATGGVSLGAPTCYAAPLSPCTRGCTSP